MSIKIIRLFFGGYEPDPVKFQELGYIDHSNLKIKSYLTAYNENQGNAFVEGSIIKKDKPVPDCNVCLFKKSDKQLLHQYITRSDGTYTFKNVAPDLEYFIVAFDPSAEHNAIVQDKIISKKLYPYL